MNKIQRRQIKERQLLVEQLKKLPIIEIACKNIGIGRATYYRWYNEDTEFQKQAEEALDEGRNFINDMAESQLLSAIKEQNMTAIIFWLKHNHRNYGTKIEISTPMESESLTPEQQEQIKEVIKKAQLVSSSTIEKHDNKTTDDR
ncbi:hypothetical protein A3I56_00435 [Candidatus Roizmanbacteria bacterium RIFCSPLOWO2_02_FULL_43_10]|uniref:Uncharacterized protein n=2 Tax=Candidatus Roizmaniibacteriota TaxID=1752723 RepID=A0A1F7K1N5_9BACT|nr:MAG: hypothetical protein A3D08_00330 [Candidatus Roizmanbacteria bacterium RIFCSPHIGHO2_02_FULL_43_11]OGK61780.1 MAG: hypothetical protein A3I56_00435 [Candidatus Roizmanbacteria bacterium RIFCSPLOWO2_02_FULL_43_10]